MASQLQDVWRQFKTILTGYNQEESTLNPPCSIVSIRQAESRLGFELPDPLKEILFENNGQRLAGEGVKNSIFKSISGWNLYERHVFLGIEAIETAYQTFIADKILFAEFGTGEIPFAVAGNPAHFREAFCIDHSTHTVSLIWTQFPDPFNPPEWQVQKFNRAESLAGFIEKQIELYQ